MENKYTKIHEITCLEIHYTYTKNLYNLLIQENTYTTETFQIHENLVCIKTLG